MWALMFNDLLSMTGKDVVSLYLHTIFRPKAAISFQIDNRGKFFIRGVKGLDNVSRNSRGFVNKGSKAYDDSTATRMSLDSGEVSMLSTFFNGVVRLTQVGKYNAQHVISLMDNMGLPFHDFGSNSFKILHTYTDNQGLQHNKSLIISIMQDGKLYISLHHSYANNNMQYSVGLSNSSTDLYLIASILEQVPIVMSALSGYYSKIKRSYGQQNNQVNVGVNNEVNNINVTNNPEQNSLGF